MNSGADKRRAKRVLLERAGRSSDPGFVQAIKVAVEALDESIGKSITLSRWRQWAGRQEGGKHGRD